MAREPTPIPDDLMPKTVPARGLSSTTLDKLEDEIAEHVSTIKTTATQEQELMQDRPAAAPATPYVPATPYAPAPRPATAVIPNQPQHQSALDFQFNGKSLRVTATCNTDAEALSLSDLLTKVAPFLAKADPPRE
jgi:hypothetical protein